MPPASLRFPFGSRSKWTESRSGEGCLDRWISSTLAFSSVEWLPVPRNTAKSLVIHQLTHVTVEFKCKELWLHTRIMMANTVKNCFKIESVEHVFSATSIHSPIKRSPKSRTMRPKVVHGCLVHRVKRLLFANPILFARALEQFYGIRSLIIHVALGLSADTRTEEALANP